MSVFVKPQRSLQKSHPPAVLTILLDELDSLLKRTNGLSEFIRSCAERAGCPLIFLLAGVPSVWQQLLDGHPSFARNAEHIKLRPFQESEVQKLMETAAKLASRTSPVRVTLGAGVSEFVFEITGGHPTLIQILGFDAMNKLRQTASGKPAEIKLTKQHIASAETTAADKFGEKVFAPWMPDLSVAQKQVLQKIAALQKKQAVVAANQLQGEGLSLAEVLEVLKLLKDEWGLLDIDNRIISRAFLTWLKSQPVLVKNPAFG